MKYLFTFASVEPCLAEKIVPLFGKGAVSVLQGDRLSMDPEQVLLQSLITDPDMVAFYRSVMDGWDATHRQLRPWIKQARSDSASLWDRFIRDGFLVVGPDEMASIGLLPRPSVREMEKSLSSSDLESYAMDAFVYALYDAIGFATETNTVLLVLGRCVGATRDDAEYGKPPQ